MNYQEQQQESEQQQQIKLQKQSETKAFKKILGTVAIAMLLAEVGKIFLVDVIFLAIRSFNLIFESAVMYGTNFDIFRLSLNPNGYEALTMDSYYIIIWICNDIISYTPYLVLFGLLLKRFSPTLTPLNRTLRERAKYNTVIEFPESPESTLNRKKHGFGMGVLVTYFMVMYSLSYVASIVSHIIAGIIADIFGTGELADVFENVMPQNTNQWLIMLIVVGVVGPVVEEIIFRHLLLKPLRRFGDGLSIGITAVLFGAFHGNFTQFLYAAVAGIILGIIAVKANSVKPAIILHVFNNSFDIGRNYLFKTVGGEHPLFNEDTLYLLYLAMILAGVILSIVFVVTKQFSVTNYNPHLSSSDRIRITLQHPLILIMAVALISVMVRSNS